MSLISQKLLLSTTRNPNVLNNLRCICNTTVLFNDNNNYLQKVTHTGQVYDEKDYRNVRFNNATRYVNPNWGIKLIEEVPPKECTERVIYCDGGDGPLGHPKVYINLDKPGAHSCGYCGLRFVKKDDHHH